MVSLPFPLWPGLSDPKSHVNETTGLRCMMVSCLHGVTHTSIFSKAAGSFKIHPQADGSGETKLVLMFCKSVAVHSYYFNLVRQISTSQCSNAHIFMINIRSNDVDRCRSDSWVITLVLLERSDPCVATSSSQMSLDRIDQSISKASAMMAGSILVEWKQFFF